MTEQTPSEDGAAVPLHRVLEAILFSSQKPVSVKEMRAVLRGAAESGDGAALAHARSKEAEIRAAMEELEAELGRGGRACAVRETGAGWQLVTRHEFVPWLRQLYPENRSARLSAPAMETLAIVAYRQPITRADIEAVRGVAVDGVMQTLLDRGLVRIAGRAEIPGRPLLYETTQFFMEHFGIKDLDELPNSDELRRIELPVATKEQPPAEPELPLGQPDGSDPQNPSDQVVVAESPEESTGGPQRDPV
jgi:segregation and condensation protein B